MMTTLTIKFVPPIMLSVVIVAGIILLMAFGGRKHGGEELMDRFLCSGQPCNMIFILADTLGAKHMGLYGYERDTTPFIDEFFGEQGVVFLNAWSNSTWTLPSLASLYTSQYPSAITTGEILKPKTASFLSVLRKAGIPIRALTSVGSAGSNMPCTAICRAATARFEPDEVVRIRDDLQLLDAAQWAQDQGQDLTSGKNPFFLFLHNVTVHSPYDPPEPYRTLFDALSPYLGSVTNDDLKSINSGKEDISPQKIERFRRQYDQELRYLDDLLKDFFEQLPQEVLDTSIVILTADHGEAFYEHGRVAHGGSPYQEVLHIPLLMKIPQAEPRIISQPVSLLDVAPTILGMFNLHSPERFLGRNLVPLVKNMDIPEMVIRAEATGGAQTFANFRNLDSASPIFTKQETAVRLGDWKLIKKSEGVLEIYNLGADPREQKNLIPQWSNLTRTEQLEILPLFHELGMELPFL